MTRHRAGSIGFFVFATALLFLPGGVGAQEPADAHRVEAERTFSGEAFSYRMRLLREEPRHRVFAVSYPSPVTSGIEANNTIPAEYYLPADLGAGDAPRPAVICLHILNGNFELVRLLCTVLAESGVPALFFKLPYYGERAPPGGRDILLRDATLFSGCLTQSISDIRRTVDLLASRPEVDGARIGISGISLGAIVAASACGLEDRLYRAQLILGGGGLKTVLNEARETRRMREFLADLPEEQRAGLDRVLERMDPLSYGAALSKLASAGRLSMVNATEDEVIPRECTERLAEAAGMTGKVTWLEGLGHYTAMAALPQIMRDTALFFARDLPEGAAAPPAPTVAALEPVDAFAGFLLQVVSFVNQPPKEGRCHYMDLVADLAVNDGKTENYSLSLIQGHGGRFRLTASPLPEVGALAIGRGAHPWMSARDDKVFVGRLEADAGKTLTSFFDPEQFMNLQMAAGVATALGQAPAAFAQFMKVTEGEAAEGERVLIVNLTHPEVEIDATLRLRAETLTPIAMELSSDGFEGTITFRHWAIDTVAHPGLFEAPEGAAAQDVPQDDLLRMFAAVFGFVMESL